MTDLKVTPFPQHLKSLANDLFSQPPTQIEPMSYPKTITGGCNCGGIRYQVDFAEDHEWKVAGHSCSCTACRKQTGSLALYLHSVQKSELTWLSKATWTEFSSAPGSFRVFCNKCGSSIAWQDREDDSETGITVGSIDEEFLVGKRDAEDKPVGGFGALLVNLDGGEHYYGRNGIEGVTDKSRGTWYWKGE
ncbi:Mss4-like protein [Mycena haematopus]|nr:Mss4-like protein [Mycena haematopus]